MVRCFWVLLLALLMKESAGADVVPAAEVRFTHPNCPARPLVGYFEPVKIPFSPANDGFVYAPSNFVLNNGVPLADGSFRSTTVDGAYCVFADAQVTDTRPDSVWAKVENLIGQSQTGDRIDISTFSFSNRGVAQLLCQALGRGVEVRIVYGSPSSMLKKLTQDQCGSDAKLVYGAGQGRLQHSKYILLERQNSEQASLSFQSANFSSGLNLHHENWTFIEVSKSDALFIKHLCHFEALFTAHFNAAESNIEKFREVFRRCLAEKLSENESSLGIEAFFVPAQQGERTDGAMALEAIRTAARKSTAIDVAAHHLSNKALLPELETALERGATVRLLLDVELFWSGRLPGQIGDLQASVTERSQLRDSDGKLPPDDYPTAAFYVRGCDRGSTFSNQEFLVVQNLVKKGALIRYIETNHRDFLFFHNKFIVFRDGSDVHGVFTGAGNLSEAGFRNNGENYYLITERSLASEFGANFDRYWDKIATPESKLPITWAVEVKGSPEWARWRSVVETTSRSCPQ